MTYEKNEQPLNESAAALEPGTAEEAAFLARAGAAAQENAAAEGAGSGAETTAAGLQRTAGEGAALPDAAPLTASPQEERKDGSMSIIAHLEELRKRLIYSMIAVAVGSGVAYFYIDDIMRCLTAPAGKLYYMQPAEAFFTYLKIAVFGGFLLAVPIVFYQIWRFILPALTMRERKALLLIVPTSVVLFFAGLLFSFFIVLPAAIRFFVGFGTDSLEPLFSLGKYLDFVLAFILPFGCVFELPLIIVVLAKLGFVGSAFLWRQQRVVVFLSFVIGAVISPTPDVFSQTMIAVPMILLYEASYLIVRFVLRK